MHSHIHAQAHMIPVTMSQPINTTNTFRSFNLEDSTFYIEAYKTRILSCIGWQCGKIDILYAVDEMEGFYTSYFLKIGQVEFWNGRKIYCLVLLILLIFSDINEFH